MSTCVYWTDDASAAVPKAPMKFYVPHVSVSFGPGGQLVWVSPNSPADGQTALVEVHSMEVIRVLGLGSASTLLNPVALLRPLLSWRLVWQEWVGFS